MSAAPTESGAPRLRSAGRRVTPERLARIADVAVDIAVESGLPAVTMQTVAKRADYIRPVVYDCYGTPENLLLTVLDQEKARVRARLTEARADADGDPTRRLVAYADVVAAAPRSWQLFALPTEGVGDAVRHSVAEFREELRRDLDEWLTDLTAGRPGTPDTEALSVLVLAAIDAIGAKMVAEPQDFAVTRIEAFLSSLARALGPARPGTRKRDPR
ncbi:MULTISPECIES: TetR/AcrR family transcriptional regulator [unclassified Nocardia]|uniref:TetR/AcrR family transcriptional regulator n=1 Tax=unclassified Nocardia TaxID=2637762 RepID=UPI00339DD6E2